MAAKWARARKEHLKPDTRPRWDDPDLKPFERVMFSDGIEREAYIPADLFKKFAEDRLAKDEGWHWTTDPTYAMKRGKSPFFRR